MLNPNNVNSQVNNQARLVAAIKRKNTQHQSDYHVNTSASAVQTADNQKNNIGDEKKRKICASDSSQSQSPESANDGSASTNTTGTFFPVFNRKVLSESKDAKGCGRKGDQSMHMDKGAKDKDKPRKKKKRKTKTVEEDKENADTEGIYKERTLSTIPAITEESLKVFDIRTVVELYNRIKTGFTKLEESSQAELKSMEKLLKEQFGRQLDDMKQHLSAEYEANLAKFKDNLKREMEKDLQETIQISRSCDQRHATAKRR